MVTELLDQFERARAAHAAAGRRGAVAVLEGLAGWTTEHRSALLR